MTAWEDDLEDTIQTLLGVAEALAGKAVEAGSAHSAESAERLLVAAEQALEAARVAAEAVPALVDLSSIGIVDAGEASPALRSLAAGDQLPRLSQGSQQLLRRSALMRAQLDVAATGRELLAHEADDGDDPAT